MASTFIATVEPPGFSAPKRQPSLPAHAIHQTDIRPAIGAALNGVPSAAYAAPSWMYLFDSEDPVRALAPDFRALMVASDLLVIVTARGDEVDFVSRFFGPQVAVDEDPVTGSAHCALVPLWAEKLDKTELTARQVSKRGGNLLCELKADRVLLRGQALTFLRGQIEVL